MQLFEITDNVTFKHINVRTEPHGDEDVLAVDLKFTGFFDANELCPLFGVDEFDVQSFKELFWDKDGHQLFHADHGIHWDYRMEKMQVEILKDRATTGQVQVYITEDAKVVRFSGVFTLAWGFLLTFTVQTEIHPDDLGILSAYLNQGMMISIEPNKENKEEQAQRDSQTSMDLSPEDDSEPEPEEQTDGEND